MRGLQRIQRERQRRNRHGIALLDAIVAGIMLGVGLTVLLSVGSRALSMQNEGQRRIQATWLADELMNMILVEGPAEYGRLYDTRGDFAEPFQEFEFEISMTNPGDGKPWEVFVMIRWPGGGGMKELGMEALIADRLGEEEDPELREPLEPLDRNEIWNDKFDSYEQGY